MSQALHLPLRLSDKRNYIFAADLFDALVATIGALPPARLRLSSMSNEAVEFCPGPAPTPQDPDYCGTFDHGRGDAMACGWLRRRPGDIVAERMAAPDATLLTEVALRADGATARHAPGVSVAKAALVLAVALIEEVFPEDLWNLAELQAVGPFHAAGPVQVGLGRRMSRFLVIPVRVDGLHWGQFTLASTPIAESTAS